MECNHFAQERKDVFGRRVVVASCRFHPTLVFSIFERMAVLLYILIKLTVIILFSSAFFSVITILIFNISIFTIQVFM